MIGRTLAHYKIISAIGAGGMGEVYRATDIKLGRDVALKILPAEFAASVDRLERFRREARLIAALNHPNIVTLHSVEEADGIQFLTMELVEGQSLDHLITSGGLSVEQILQIAIPLTDALAAAHEKGIIHRDLKPQNIMIGEKGRIKILDFGLAKIAGKPDEASGSQLQTEMQTREGIVMGTAPYMSPEQISGRPTDQRTDLFSVGIILYEMTTGQRPFKGNSSAELISSILRDTPRPIDEIRAGTSPELSRIIQRCLEKEADSRFQSARELHDSLFMLRQPATLSSETKPHASSSSRTKIFIGIAAVVLVSLLAFIGIYRQKLRSVESKPQTVQAPAKSIAVLPFVNESGNPDDEYFSDGMTDELTIAFTKVPGLRVAARSSSFRFKSNGADAREVGTKLNVGTILEGSVRRYGSKVRVTAQLVNAADGLALWSERYEREAKDVFAVQDDITNAIVSALKLTLSVSPVSHTENAEAHDLYLRGRFLMLKQSEEGLRKSLDYFEQALAKDPNYASAYAGIAFAWAYLADAVLPPNEAYPKAKDAALKALKLDPNNSEARTMYGVIQWVYDWDMDAAKNEFRRVLQADPNSLDAHNFYGICLCASKRFDEGLAEVDRAINLDPLNAWPSWMREYCLTMARRYDDVIAQQQKTKELDPYLYYLDSWVGVAYREKGMFQQSVDEYQRVQQLSGNLIPGLAITYARMGKTREARDILQRLLAFSQQKYLPPEQLAGIYASLGEKDQALSWMDKAYEVRSGALPVIFQSPVFDPLRSEPRFHTLLKKMNLE